MNCQNINDSRKINVLFTDGFFIVFRSKIQAGYFRVKWNKLTGNEGVKSLTGHRKLWIGCFGELKSEEKLIDKLFWNIFLWSIYNINWLLMIALYYQCSDMGKGKEEWEKEGSLLWVLIVALWLRKKLTIQTLL